MALNEISKNRIKLYRIIKEYNKNASNKEAIVVSQIINEIKKDNNKHFLSFESDGSITYASSPDKKYTNRVKTTIGRYVRRKLKITNNKLNDTFLSNFSDFVKQRIMVDSVSNDIEILKGKGIQDFYIKAHKKCKSCMTGEKYKGRIRFYADNPDKVNLVTTKDGRTRALLWIADNGTKVLDRIYGNDFNKIKSWALKNKILLLNKDITKIKKLRITMNYNSKKFPSLDAFKYGKLNSVKRIPAKGIVVLSNNCTFGNVVLITCSPGFLS